MEYVVAEIVVSESGVVPLFRFSESWSEIEAGQDRQILGRRWLTDHGSIWVTEASEVASVWMTLRIPSPQNGASRLTLEAGAEEPRVVISTSCGDAEAILVGSGRHEVDLVLSGVDATESDECEIEIAPNFQFIENGGFERRTVLLEALAWGAQPEPEE